MDTKPSTGGSEPVSSLTMGAEVLPGGDAALAGLLALAKSENRPLRIKLGVDPTSADLHLGHAVVLRALRRFQDAGHQVILLIGGFTATIGDPTGRDVTRPALTTEQVAVNAQTYLEQAARILDMSRVELVNNNDWFGTMSLLELVRLTSLVTVNQLVAKESFGTRIEGQHSVGLHELLYPVLQGFDSVHLRADIEVGGSDQRFNVLMGRQLQNHFGQKPQLVMLLPLLEGTDGVCKMSKSLGNAIALREKPDDMFGKCMRIADDKIVRWFTLATAAGAAEIAQVEASLAAGVNPKELKEALARRIVSELHGLDAGSAAFAFWQKVHCQRQVPEQIEEHKVVCDDASSFALIDALVSSGLAPSRNQARKLVTGGGVRLDGTKVSDAASLVDLSAGRSVVLQVGKRSFVRLSTKSVA